jgi:hypothetical protein
MPAPTNAMWFRVNAIDGSLYPIMDSVAASSSSGDGMVAVTGVPAGVSFEAVRALLYAACGVLFGWGGGGFKFSVPYFNLLTPNAVPVGWISLPTNPIATNTITLNGTVWTFVASGAVGPQTNIGGTAAATMSTLVTNLNASADAQVAKNTYAVSPASPTTLQITNKTAGTGNNGYTLATNVSGGSVSPGGLIGGATVATPAVFTIP